MKILAIADEESKALWDHFDQNKQMLEGVELIISCGDLKASYLEFLVTMTNATLLYVRGNHDGRYDQNPPEGCICIDDTVYNYKGLRILGLGGSFRYNDSPCMYTEEAMKRRILRLPPQIRMKNGFDLLVTHAPAAGYGDLPDLPHKGFACFNTLLYQYRPQWMLHGHVHANYGHFQREHRHPGGTRIANVYDHYLLDVEEGSYPAYGKTGSALYDLYINLLHQDPTR